MTPLDRLFFWLRAKPFFYRLTLFTRIMLAAGFIPTGMVKLLGHRFTTISTDQPIGAFFEAMYQTGLFWHFIGLAQVVAGLLLLFPKVAHLGAALFLPIILNILVITVGLQFGGTPFVVASMLLAVGFLCVWDFHRFRSLFSLRPALENIPTPQLDRWEKIGFFVFAFSLMNFFGVTRSFIGPEFAMVFLATGLLAGLLTLGRFLWLLTQGRLAAAVSE
jgi:DoxX